ncbi:RHS repeat-associated core domain-containing protein [uncultured Chryseobacterium sp.]|uniref:RHS repeat-associated core domain-containing protein n=1 Tax=uncultured Chryseobacterium sp. TaxID=259322 RepID=UPI00345A95D2
MRNEEEEAKFGTGSYANHKYNSKELQETGMYDYGWRHYMADLGRWNGVDQLAEMYVSTSTYAYVANNPVLRFDVGGRWFNDDGTIDTSGYTRGFTTGKQYRESFLGTNKNDGGGGGGSLWVGEVTADNGITIGDLLDAWLNSSKNYFEDIDFTQFGAENIDCPKCPNQIHKEGEQVLEPKETFLGKLWATLEPRTWNDGGITYNVGADGKIVGIAPLTGTVPFGPGSSFNILKSFKSALSLSKGGLTNVGRAIQKHPNILRLIGKETSSITTNAARNQSGVEALKYIIRNGVREVKSHKTFGTVVEYKFPNGLGARFNAETNEFIGFLGRGL